MVQACGYRVHVTLSITQSTVCSITVYSTTLLTKDSSTTMVVTTIHRQVSPRSGERVAKSPNQALEKPAINRMWNSSNLLSPTLAASSTGSGECLWEKPMWFMIMTMTMNNNKCKTKQSVKIRVSYAITLDYALAILDSFITEINSSLQGFQNIAENRNTSFGGHVRKISSSSVIIFYGGCTQLGRECKLSIKMEMLNQNNTSITLLQMEEVLSMFWMHNTTLYPRPA